MVKPRICSICKRSLAFLALLCLARGATLSGAPQPTAFARLHDFANLDGFNPVFSLVAGPDNVLYGSAPRGGTDSYGTVFKLNNDGSGFAVVHHFSPADLNAAPTLIPGCQLLRGRDGALYGTAQGGTNYSSGMIFKVNPDGSGYTILHGFTSADNGPFSLMQANDDLLYGAGSTCVFRLDTNGNQYAVLHTFNAATEGRFAYGKLAQGSDGALYGTAQAGGTNSAGTVFKLNPDGSGFLVLHTFGSGTDGKKPYAGLLVAAGALYGTTTQGGSNNLGTLFQLSPDGSVYQVLHHFQGGSADGASPFGPLVQGLNNLLYGTTSAGGTNGGGTLFELGLDGSGYVPLYHFGANAANGTTPYAGLVQGPASDGSGVLYGTTFNGGVSGVGTVFAAIVNPPLSITPTVGQLGSRSVITWPAWALNYVLQTTTNVATGPWAAATNGVPVTGLQVTNAAPGAYYRLIWQP